MNIVIQNLTFIITYIKIEPMPLYAVFELFTLGNLVFSLVVRPKNLNIEAQNN